MAPLRASLARSPPRLGRSQAGGLHPQTPRAAPPGAPSRTGPLLPRSPSRRGSGHGCDGGGGGQPLAVVHARRLAPGGFRASGEIQKVGRADARRGFGGVPPVGRRRWQPGPGGGRPGAAACGCARRPRTGRGCPRAPGFRARTTYRGEAAGRKPAPNLDASEKKDGERNI